MTLDLEKSLKKFFGPLPLMVTDGTSDIKTALVIVIKNYHINGRGNGFRVK